MNKPTNKKVKSKPIAAAAPVDFPISEWLDKYAWYAVIILTAIGFVIRVYKLDYLSLWSDEFIIPDQAAGVFHGRSILSSHDNNGIFLTVLVFLSYKLFGISDFTARIVNVILGSLVIPTVYFLAKELFNRFVGVTAAVLATISMYSVYWSRIARNYANFELFYLVLVIVSWFMLESHKPKAIYGWFDRYRISKKYFILFPIALFVSLMNHQLTFFFIFTFMAYGSGAALWKIVKKHDGRFNNKYAWILYGTTLFVFLFYMPFMADIIRPIVGLIMHEEGVLWFIPRWSIIFDFWKSADPNRVFNIYMSVFKADMPNFWWLGFIGLAAAFWIRKKAAAFLVSLFLVPLLLMSYVFYDPATTRYLIFLYPFFLIGIGVALFVVWKLIGNYLIPPTVASKPLVSVAAVIGTVVFVVLGSPRKELKALIDPQRHGMISKPEISNWYFSNWKEAALNVKSQIKPTDVIFSTMPSGTNHYLGVDSSLWFRQMHYSEYVKRYISNDKVETAEPNGTTYENFIETVRRYRRGWVFADYYFYNVMTDPRVRDYVIKNLKYHFDACSDGTVQVFSWDIDAPESPKSFIIELGKSPEMQASQQLPVNLTAVEGKSKVLIFVDGEAIDDREAFVVVNNAHSAFLSPTNNEGRKALMTALDLKWFQSGQNIIQFGYNRNVPQDIQKGFAIYNVSFSSE
jgi:hypothetical protein